VAQLVIYLDTRGDSGQLQAPGSFTTEKSGSGFHWIVAWEGHRASLGALEKSWSYFAAGNRKRVSPTFYSLIDCAVAADTVDEETNYLRMKKLR